MFEALILVRQQIVIATCALLSRLLPFRLFLCVHYVAQFSKGGADGSAIEYVRRFFVSKVFAVPLIQCG